MASKKLKILFTLCMLLSLGAFAQTTASSSSVYNVYDSSVIPSKRMGQQNEFWNNTYNFPAKPRNMWEIGISGGLPTLSSDVSSQVPTWGGAVHVRKALGYIFSIRAQYLYANTKGLNWQLAQGYAHNSAWTANGYNPQLESVVYNYKTNVQDLGLQGIVTLNNIRFHKNKTGMILYAGAGIGATLYEAKINALNDKAKYNFSSILSGFIPAGMTYKNRKDIKKALKNAMDDSYETKAEGETDRRPTLGGKTVKPSGTVLAGLAFKLGRRVNLAIEDRLTFVKTDLLDGQRWQEHSGIADPSLTRDFDSYNYASLGLNFNLGAKSVEPLYWVNPLDYAYSELNVPKHMLLPKPLLNDADDDGVIDQLDREPNTPAGCPVDTHGVTKDTDGDGVPDCKDKQLITPTECQPVDADGVGKCPDPECCKNPPPAACPSNYPSISFKGNYSTLSNDAKAQLASVAALLKANPNCNISVTGYPDAKKSAQAVCNARNSAIVNYLTESLGISGSRISTDCVVGGGDTNTVDIKSN